ncbi:MAG: acetyl-CoA carboxylase biotin carboxylase subunit [Candidatus Aminicenantales bacterium]
MVKKIKKILIANRGEIAVRIIRTCREMGISPVCIYSERDRKALHVRLADEAYEIGPAKPSQSYLNIDKIIAVAKRARVEAIHPGYGFLAENAEFVRRCEKEGFIFVGPSSPSMEIMGNKTYSRQKMVEAGIPIIPGMMESLKDESELGEKAREIGFPLLLKASAGGGGKGMRLVESEKGLFSAFRMARSEALSSFDDPSIYIEKYIEEPHHIEVQILADNEGNIIYLGERECSIQRRYQKVIEETPSPFLDDEKRNEMGRVAVRAAGAVGYRNAGTVEFVVDRERRFYFLEMNTRLQVEHPITEMVTGIDLVRSQIEIAAGLPLSFSQEDINPRGHSLECRIYAEDSENNFMPSPGKIVHFRTPAGGLGVRDDNGVYEGYEVPLEYDPLLSKLITWGMTRDEAIQRMLRALSEYQVFGIKTTIPFFKKILNHPKFLKGEYNTNFIPELERLEEKDKGEERTAAVIAAGIKSYLEGKMGLQPGSKQKDSNWKIQGRLNSLSQRLP